MFLYILDDAIIFSENLEEHYKHVKQFLLRCFKHRIMLSKEKVEIAKKKIEFLRINYLERRNIITPHIAEDLLNFLLDH